MSEMSEQTISVLRMLANCGNVTSADMQVLLPDTPEVGKILGKLAQHGYAFAIEGHRSSVPLMYEITVKGKRYLNKLDANYVGQVPTARVAAPQGEWNPPAWNPARPDAEAHKQHGSLRNGQAVPWALPHCGA